MDRLVPVVFSRSVDASLSVREAAAGVLVALRKRAAHEMVAGGVARALGVTRAPRVLSSILLFLATAPPEMYSHSAPDRTLRRALGVLLRDRSPSLRKGAQDALATLDRKTLPVVSPEKEIPGPGHEVDKAALDTHSLLSNKGTLATESDVPATHEEVNDKQVAPSHADRLGVQCRPSTPDSSPADVDTSSCAPAAAPKQDAPPWASCEGGAVSCDANPCAGSYRDTQAAMHLTCRRETANCGVTGDDVAIHTIAKKLLSLCANKHFHEQECVGLLDEAGRSHGLQHKHTPIGDALPA